MSTKKKEAAPEMILEKKEKQTDIQVRMETGKIEIMKVVEGIPGAEKLAELIERGKKKGKLSSSELLDVLEGCLPEGPQLFPEDMTSDQPERQLIAEIIREKSLILLQREVPHGVAVGIERAFEFRACRLQAAVDFAESAAERRHRLVAASKQCYCLAGEVHGFEAVEKIGEIVLYVAVAPCGATKQYHIIVADARRGGIRHVVNVGHVYAERTPDTVGSIGCISGRGSKNIRSFLIILILYVAYS